MPRKLLTWVGSFVIVAAAGFCWWALMRYRDAYGVIDARFNLLTIGAFVTPIVAVIAILLWYYVNERR